MIVEIAYEIGCDYQEEKQNNCPFQFIYPFLYNSFQVYFHEFIL